MDETLRLSSPRFKNAGRVTSRGELLTLNTPEYHSAAAESSLSQILEQSNVPPKYFLSPRACMGVLNRALRRGKELPPQLSLALSQVAAQGQPERAMFVRKPTCSSLRTHSPVRRDYVHREAMVSTTRLSKPTVSSAATNTKRRACARGQERRAI